MVPQEVNVQWSPKLWCDDHVSRAFTLGSGVETIYICSNMWAFNLRMFWENIPSPSTIGVLFNSSNGKENLGGRAVSVVGCRLPVVIQINIMEATPHLFDWQVPLMCFRSGLFPQMSFQCCNLAILLLNPINAKSFDHVVSTQYYWIRRSSG